MSLPFLYMPCTRQRGDAPSFSTPSGYPNTTSLCMWWIDCHMIRLWLQTVVTGWTYECVLLEDLFTLCGKLYRHYRDFPSIIAAPDLGSCSSSDDLVTKTYTDDTNSILFEQFLCKVDELQDPWVVVEAVVFCHRSTPIRENRLTRRRKHTGTGDQYSIYLLQVRVFLCSDHIIGT